MSELGIGSTVWVFDRTCRLYHMAVCELAFGHPLYRKFWVPIKIIDENRVSWITGQFPRRKLSENAGPPRKFPKKGGPIRMTNMDAWGALRIAVSAEAVDEDCWLNGNRRYIVERVSRCDDATMLRQVAALVGYEEESA